VVVLRVRGGGCQGVAISSRRRLPGGGGLVAGLLPRLRWRWGSHAIRMRGHVALIAGHALG
jgi:hypothetical protein